MPKKRLNWNTNNLAFTVFFTDGTHERVRHFVKIKEAIEAAWHYSGSVAARSAMVKRVIITDGGDCIAWEWIA